MEPSAINGRDTICAISTPPGVGGIAVARVSGPDAVAIADSLWHGRRLSDAGSHTAHLGTIAGTDGRPLDQCVATVYRAPRSFTGDDVVEIAVHGSRYVQRELLNSLVAAGARMAEAGEFTRRAFAAGKMDLAEAEAVADVIASNSRAAHRIALSQMRGGFSRRLCEMRDKLVNLASLLELELDFSEEEVEFASRDQLRSLAVDLQREIERLHGSFTAGSAIKDGIPVAIVGATNAGKSSLLNALVGDDRAIVSAIHGTTRDTIEETLEVGDYLFRFIDTAGIRATDDAIERIGIQRSRRAMTSARIVIVVIDVTETGTADSDIDAALSRLMSDTDTAPRHLIVALNKTDLLPSGNAKDHQDRADNLSDAATGCLSDSANDHQRHDANARPTTDIQPNGTIVFSAAGTTVIPSNNANARQSTDIQPNGTIVFSAAGTTVIPSNGTTVLPGADELIFLHSTDGSTTLTKTAVRISALTGAGIDEIRSALITAAESDSGDYGHDDVLVTNARHAQALGQAAGSIARVIDGLGTGLPGDLIAQDLRETIHHLAAITGDIPSAEILSTIFSRFCIGK